MDIDLRELAKEEIDGLSDCDTIPMEIEPLALFQLIGQLQLALRHPDNKGADAAEARAFAVEARRRLCEPGSALDILIGMGDSSNYGPESAPKKQKARLNWAEGSLDVTRYKNMPDAEMENRHIATFERIRADLLKLRTEWEGRLTSHSNADEAIARLDESLSLNAALLRFAHSELDSIVVAPRF